jgi:hypothetical protein
MGLAVYTMKENLEQPDDASLIDLAIVHPNASEALVRCLQSRFDRPT